MTGKVASLYGGPTGELMVNDNCVAALERWLEKARAGEVVGITVAAVHHDGLTSYGVDGFVGGYGIIGALEIAKTVLVDIATE